MSKVWPDGSVHYSESGKTVKPPAWTDPRRLLKLAIEEQNND
jgi:predicted HAD superfamily Cof-like phosphohydrolase